MFLQEKSWISQSVFCESLVSYGDVAAKTEWRWEQK